MNIASISANDVDLSSIPSVGQCVGLCVCLCVCPKSVLWQNGWLDLDAVWDGMVSGVGRGTGVLDGAGDR